jgi:hypothetical protein
VETESSNGAENFKGGGSGGQGGAAPGKESLSGEGEGIGAGPRGSESLDDGNQAKKRPPQMPYNERSVIG